MTVPTLSPFRLAWVQAFAAVTEYGSTAAAARQIGCDQSTISRSLTHLGAFLGGKLFEGENSLKLTPLGEAFLPKAGELMDWARSVRRLKDDLPAVVPAAPARQGIRGRMANWFKVG